ncbi:neutral and basic amino acid transport protein rBAT-like isoform X1 [Vespa mandarinia]|uniref:neutral and basic amino acid transport protein rBAT-like isoform X1 n=1 Tax=Vespa mandarinia TaxID=7446 RepID=UPI00161DAD32|nr:neutral and basic amino acid transport protein rBAT-like isoform X1 [Vespa mandarinia]XP_035742846.1 neutral and basic amino acid transport protein rBAT-like isoform X1 [Vespa mandarinia]
MESGRQDLDNNEMKESSRASSVVPTCKSETDDSTPVSFDQQLKSYELLNMGKQNGGESDLDDGTKERMLTDESKISPTKDATEVKFISENGDAKIDIETAKQTFSGMGKEELMKFANDPFWVRLRWFLFISFWILWIAMLAGAIAIILMAPKCVAPKPRKWWEESPIVRLQFSDSPTKNLKGFQSLLDELKEQHIKAICLPSIMKGSLEGHTENFIELDPQVGDISDLEDLIKAAKERDQHLILELDPNHSSMKHFWFEQSVNNKNPYTDYYIWADGHTSDGERQPPNNWLSVNGGSAWEWNEQRGQYYLHQFNKFQPDLNFSNPQVVGEFENILKHWLKLGINGFRLANTQYLTEDPILRDESLSTIPTETDNYQSLVHVYTRDRPKNVAVLTKWQEIVYNETKGQGLFTLQDDIGADILEVYNEKKALSLPQNSQFLTTANASINATILYKGIKQWINISSWPGWDVNGEQYSLRQRMAGDIADSITLMFMLLPGTPILRLNDTLSAKNAFAILAKARTSATFLYGETDLRVVNGSVFVYTRSWLKSGNPGYLVAYQSEEYPTIIDLSSIPGISEEVTILTYSPNYTQNGGTLKTKLSSNMIPISSKSTLILTFVPKDDVN